MKTPEEIRVGMGGTYCIGSDRYPVTVIEVVRANKVIVQFDNFKIESATDGYGIPESYTPNPNGATYEVTKRKVGWKVKGTEHPVHLGQRNAYRDPHF